MKLEMLLQMIETDQVAPRRGAWVETQWVYLKNPLMLVAPRRGAWVETCVTSRGEYTVKMSHPAGVRGLKLVLQVEVSIR